MLDDGLLTVYEKIVTDENRGALDATPLKKVGTAFYGEISFTAAEYYAAKQAETAIVRRVQIHQDKNIGSNHVVVIGDTQYDVGRTYSTVTRGVAVTEITLERATRKYDVAGTNFLAGNAERGVSDDATGT